VSFPPSEQGHVIDGSASTSHLKPGGYIEQFEILVDIKSDDGTVTNDGALKKFNDLCEVSKLLFLRLLLPSVF
jgi:hypothetical protein